MGDGDPKSLLALALEISGEEEAVLLANQQEFAETFGEDFRDAEIHAFWVGPSPGGESLGIEFRRLDGQIVRVSLPVGFLERFWRDFQTAFATVLYRHTLEGSKTGGEA
jgi:hypothetical protein